MEIIYGKGLSATDANKKPNEYAQMMTLISKDCLRKIALDRKLFGQFSIQVHYNDKHDKILKAYHIPVNLIRAEKCNKDGEIEGYYYSDDWSDVKKYVPKRFPYQAILQGRNTLSLSAISLPIASLIV